MSRDVRRRDIVKGMGIAGVSFGLAGCTGNGNGNGGGDGGPDGLFIVGYPEDGQQLFRDYYSTSDGSEDILIPDGMRDGALPGQVGNDMSNVIGTAPAAGGPAQEAFESAFQDRYGEAPGVFTSQSYDSAATLILANVAAGENDGTAVRDQMRNVANPGGTEITPDNFVEGVEIAADGQNINYQGASSDVNFNAAGDPANAAYDIWEFDGQDSDSTSRVETQSFEGENPEGAGPSADEIPGSDSGRTIELGILLPTSGNLASVGGPMTQAAEMAALEINEADVDFEVNPTVEDTETRSSAGTEAAERLVGEGIPMACGTASSGVNVPVSDGVLAPSEVVGCSPSSTAISVTNLEDDDYIFRTAPSDILQGTVDANVMADRLGASSVSTLYVDNDYGQQLNDQFVEIFDGEVLSENAYGQGDSSYSSVVQTALGG